MSLQKELKPALASFLNSGNENSLISIINAHPEIVMSSFGDYPDLHRIVDICVGGKCYRVCRQISTGEKLTLSLVDKALDDPGVPIWLEGEKLKKWAKSEEDNPSDEPTDWDSYR